MGHAASAKGLSVNLYDGIKVMHMIDVQMDDCDFVSELSCEMVIVLFNSLDCCCLVMESIK